MLYEFSSDSKNENLTIIQKYSEKDLNESLEKLKICHNGRFILLNKTKKQEDKTFTLNPEILDKFIGAEFQPVSINIIFQNKDYKFRTYTNLILNEFKKHLQKYFNFDYNVDITLKSINKNINLDNIAFDKKNNLQLTLKQLKVNDKSILIISKFKSETDQGLDNLREPNSNQNKNNNNDDDKESVKVSNIVCLEDDRDNPQIIRTKLNQTFDNFLKKIAKKFNLTPELNLRLRKYNYHLSNLNFLLIYLNLMF